MEKVVKSETYANYGFVIKYIALYSIVENLSNIIRQVNGLKPAVVLYVHVGENDMLQSGGKKSLTNDYRLASMLVHFANQLSGTVVVSALMQFPAITSVDDVNEFLLHNIREADIIFWRHAGCCFQYVKDGLHLTKKSACDVYTQNVLFAILRGLHRQLGTCIRCF